jgi:hypothetical protein
VFFANFGASQFADTPLTLTSKAPVNGLQPVIGFQQDFITGAVSPVLGDPINVSGFRLVDGRASYGLGLETFALGFPIHFDWAWRTLFNRDWENYVYSYRAALDGDSSGSRWLRRPKFSVWIGYDF